MAATGAAFSSAAAQDKKPAIFELTTYKLRNSAADQSSRTPQFLGQVHLPTLKHAGAGAVGLFRNSIAPEGPFVITLVSYPDLAAYETVQTKLAVDDEYRKKADAYYNDPKGIGFERIESRLLRAFSKVPDIEVPPAREGGRIFELRMYESNSPVTLQRKVEMFQTGGEIAIFRKSGLLPVFFATTIVGTHMPNLTYMLAFDSLAAREHGWGVFGASPEWKELRARPGLSDIETVSNISNIILTAAPGSEIL
jgi:NIPSNAP